MSVLTLTFRVLFERQRKLTQDFVTAVDLAKIGSFFRFIFRW